MIYLLSMFFTVAFVYYSKWQFIDDRNGPSGKWHSYGFLMRILMFVIPFITQYYPSGWQDFLLAGTLNIMLWEVCVNKIALGVDWFYVGTTSKLDIKLGKKKWFIYGASVIIALAIKIFI